MSKNDKGLAAATVAGLIIVGWIISKLNTERQEKEKKDMKKLMDETNAMANEWLSDYSKEKLKDTSIFNRDTDE